MKRLFMIWMALLPALGACGQGPQRQAAEAADAAEARPAEAAAPAAEVLPGIEVLLHLCPHLVCHGQEALRTVFITGVQPVAA